MRYKHHIERRIRVYIEHELFNYRKNKSTLASLRDSMMPSISAGIEGGVAGGGANSSKTENSALRLATDARIDHLTKSISAIDRALAKSSANMQKLIKLVYIVNSHSIAMAGYEVHEGTTNAYSMINDFIILVAYEMGLIDES